MPLLGGTLVPGGSLLVLSGLVAGANGSLAFALPGFGTFPVTLFVQGIALNGPQALFSNAVRLELGL
jgi:hypothetical protein